MAFADDLLIIANNKTDFEEMLRACEEIQVFGFKLNLKKTQIMTDHLNMKGVTRSAA